MRRRIYITKWVLESASCFGLGVGVVVTRGAA